MSSCSFTYSATTKTIRSPRFPENNPELPRQTIGKSGGGAHWVYTWAGAGKQVRLKFARLTPTEKADLESFIVTTVNYSATAFTYTDPGATAHTNMRFVDFGGWFQREAGAASWSIDLILERED